MGRWRQVPDPGDSVVVEEEWLPAAGGQMRGVRLTLRAGVVEAAVPLVLTAQGRDVVYAEGVDEEPGTYRDAPVGNGVHGFRRPVPDGVDWITYIQEADCRMIVHRTVIDQAGTPWRVGGDIRRFRRLVFPHER